VEQSANERLLVVKKGNSLFNSIMDNLIKKCIFIGRQRVNMYWILNLLLTIQAVPEVNGQPIHLRQYIDSLNQVSFEMRVSSRSASISAAKSAIALSEAIYEEGLMYGHLNLGINYTNLSKFDSAIYCLDYCKAYFENSPLEYGLVRYYTGINFSNLGDFDRALRLFDEANELFEKTDDVKYQASVQNSIGIVEFKQGNYDAALAYLLSAYKIKLSNELSYDEELANISIVYRIMGQFDKALEFAERSMNICLELQDSLGLAQTYVSIGKIFHKMNESDSAIYFFNRAFELSKRNGFDRQVASSLVNKSDVLLDMGKPNAAIAELKQVLDFKSIENDIAESVHLEMAIIFESIGQYDSAIHNALIVEKRAEGSANLSNLASAKQLLGQIYEINGDHLMALKYLKDYLEINEQIQEKKNESEISDLRIQIETLEKENEINQLNQELTFDRLKRQRLWIALIGVVMVAGLLVLFLVYRHIAKNKLNEWKHAQLKNEVEKAQNDLYQQTLHMVRMNNCLTDIESQIRSSREVSKPLNTILKIIKVNKSLDKEWEHFNQYFGNVHDNFFERLTEISSGLSNHEQRVCALIRLNLSNHEVATLLSIENKSVIMLKYRIKKKLLLDQTTDLKEFLLKI
jgi:tetratricopeptide (TPR) repeat protein